MPHPDRERIKEIAKARRYRIGYSRGTSPWLQFTPSVERAGTYPLEKLFVPFELFSYEVSTPYPHLRLFTPLHRTENFEEAYQRYQELYGEIAEQVTRKHRDDTGDLHGALPELNGVLLGIYDLMDRIEPRLRQPFFNGRRVIEAWVVETEKALLEDGKGDTMLERLREEEKGRGKTTV